MLDLHRLRLLRELHARGTVAAVAEALPYSPSTVSHQLTALQREAGVTLFERDGRRLRLTEAARVLVRHADALLTAVERAEAEMVAAAGAIAGVVRVAAFQTAAIRLVTPAVADLAARHPGLRVEVTEVEAEHALASLTRRECDLAVCDEYEEHPRQRSRGLTYEEVYAEHVRLVLPRGTPARLRDLAGAAWAGGHRGTSHERLIVQVCATLGGFVPDIRHRTTDLLVLLSLVRTGQAVTLLPDLAPLAQDPAVDVRDIAERPVRRRIFCVARDESLARPALAAVRAALRRGPDR